MEVGAYLGEKVVREKEYLSAMLGKLRAGQEEQERNERIVLSHVVNTVWNQLRRGCSSRRKFRGVKQNGSLARRSISDGQRFHRNRAIGIDRAFSSLHHNLGASYCIST